jgi:hypothetical protein
VTSPSGLLVFSLLVSLGPAHAAEESAHENPAADPVTIDLARRPWQGIPGVERTAKGRVFVSWFTGGAKEPEAENTCALSYSDDGGETFTPPAVIALPEVMGYGLKTDRWSYHERKNFQTGEVVARELCDSQNDPL